MEAIQRVNIHQSKTSLYMIICWSFAACGGLMLGYVIGISGGVMAMDDFLIRFSPKAYGRKIGANENNYCKFNDHKLSFLTSSLYLAAVITTCGASKSCSKFGRRLTILVASIFFLVGAALSAGAQAIWMLILGRIFQGCGVGFINMSVPLFLSEVAPTERRGSVYILFQLFITIGILLANLVNYGASHLHRNGWRVSLGIAAAPAFFLFISSFIIPETPTSLIQGGHEDAAKETLKKIRGVDEVTTEYMEIKAACERAGRAKAPLLKILNKRSNWPPLIITIMLQMFQQFSGINAIMLYAPVLFQMMGMKTGASLLSAAIAGVINVAGTLLANYAFDKFGRRVLLLSGCLIMFVCQIILGGLLIRHLDWTNSLTVETEMRVAAFVCLLVFAFAWSWGPIGWLIPSETFPLEIRTQGFAFAVTVNMIFTFISTQALLSFFCQIRAFFFLWFAGLVFDMALFVKLGVPETRNVPIDAMVERVWKLHPVWKKFMDDDVVVHGARVTPQP